MAKRKGNDINGIVILDKAFGLTSNKALQQIKRLFNAKKAGHTGSLDPMATGVLPICFGKATKICQYLLDSDKTYTAIIQLGVGTTTGDAEGDIIKKSVVPCLFEKDIIKALNKFIGKISQIPPMYSALKKNGVPLYKLARDGIEIDRPAREVNIFKLELINYDAKIKQIKIITKCSKGTYIRTLGEDIATELNSCAHLVELRRTSCGPFEDKLDSTSLSEIENKLTGGHVLSDFILSAESAFVTQPIYKLDDEAYNLLIKSGKFIAITPNINGLYRLYNKEGFIGIADFIDGQIIKKQLF